MVPPIVNRRLAETAGSISLRPSSLCRLDRGRGIGYCRSMSARFASFLVCLSAAIAPIAAHHSFSAQYDAAKQVKLEGVVTKIAWANPHVFFYVDVKNGDGATVNWACETNGPNGLIRQGWKRDSLKVGDRVTVTAYLAKDGTNTVDARQVTLPDGSRRSGGTASPARASASIRREPGSTSGSWRASGRWPRTACWRRPLGWSSGASIRAFRA